jgi:hypothetical protein
MLNPSRKLVAMRRRLGIDVDALKRELLNNPNYILNFDPNPENQKIRLQAKLISRGADLALRDNCVANFYSRKTIYHDAKKFYINDELKNLSYTEALRYFCDNNSFTKDYDKLLDFIFPNQEVWKTVLIEEPDYKVVDRSLECSGLRNMNLNNEMLELEYSTEIILSFKWYDIKKDDSHDYVLNRDFELLKKSCWFLKDSLDETMEMFSHNLDLNTIVLLVKSRAKTIKTHSFKCYSYGPSTNNFSDTVNSLVCYQRSYFLSKEVSLYRRSDPANVQIGLSKVKSLINIYMAVKSENEGSIAFDDVMIEDQSFKEFLISHEADLLLSCSSQRSVYKKLFYMFADLGIINPIDLPNYMANYNDIMIVWLKEQKPSGMEYFGDFSLMMMKGNLTMLFEGYDRELSRIFIDSDWTETSKEYSFQMLRKFNEIFSLELDHESLIKSLGVGKFGMTKTKIHKNTKGFRLLEERLDRRYLMRIRVGMNEDFLYIKSDRIKMGKTTVAFMPCDPYQIKTSLSFRGMRLEYLNNQNLWVRENDNVTPMDIIDNIDVKDYKRWNIEIKKVETTISEVNLEESKIPYSDDMLMGNYMDEAFDTVSKRFEEEKEMNPEEAINQFFWEQDDDRRQTLFKSDVFLGVRIQFYDLLKLNLITRCLIQDQSEELSLLKMISSYLLHLKSIKKEDTPLYYILSYRIKNRIKEVKELKVRRRDYESLLLNQKLVKFLLFEDQEIDEDEEVIVRLTDY